MFWGGCTSISGPSSASHIADVVSHRVPGLPPVRLKVTERAECPERVVPRLPVAVPGVLPEVKGQALLWRMRPQPLSQLQQLRRLDEVGAVSGHKT